jgi:hypothetical protein
LKAVGLMHWLKKAMYGARFPTEIYTRGCSANMRVTNGIPLGSLLLLLVCTVNCVQTLKANRYSRD